MKIYTIRDIAEMAGVSVTTVSRVLNNRPDVSAETVKKVQRVMQECHFVVNPNARGLKQAAENSAAHAHYLAGLLDAIPGFELKTKKPFFHEFVTACPVDPKALQERLDREGILGGLSVEGGILWCCTEKNTRGQIERLAEICREVSGK